MIKLRNVSKFYNSKGMITSGISRVNLEFDRGEFVVITGESGSGKSTLLNVISGLDSYEEGDMLIHGQSTSHYMAADFEAYRKKYIGNVFQNFNLINSYTVYQNVELVLRINGYSRSQMKKLAMDIIDRVGLSDFRNTKASKLSGGQKQRVAIARALARQTDIIVADEPTGNLDSKSATEIAKLLSEISKDRLVIVVTHNFEQFEGYATRVVKMHDGRVVENTTIKQLEISQDEIETTEKKPKATSISALSVVRLGLRNTFNIPFKFILLTLVFLFMVTASASQYTSYLNAKYTGSDSGYNSTFANYSKDRIILTKEDNTVFSDSDVEAISEESNVNRVEANDMLLDNSIYFEKGGFSYTAYPRGLDGFEGKLDAGEMPESEDEVILAGMDDGYLFTKDNIDNILGQTFKIYFGDDEEMKVKVTGIKFYSNANSSYEGDVYFTNDKMNKMRRAIYYQISKIETDINGKIQVCEAGSSYYGLVASNKVKKGEAIVTSEADGFYTKGGIKGKTITTEVSNLYFNKKVTLKVTDTYTDKTYSRKTGRNDYEDFGSAIFINFDDYNELFKDGNYQVSVYVSDSSICTETGKSLENMGYNALVLKDATSSDSSNIEQIIRGPLVVIMLIALLFITYFVTRLILRSRQEYFSVLRMLGLAKGSIRRILNVELFVVVCIAFGIFLGITQLALNNTIPVQRMAEMVKYMEVRDYVVLFALVEAMALIISMRFSGKLFKKTAIGSFREEE